MAKRTTPCVSRRRLGAGHGWVDGVVRELMTYIEAALLARVNREPLRIQAVQGLCHQRQGGRIAGRRRFIGPRGGFRADWWPLREPYDPRIPDALRNLEAA